MQKKKKSKRRGLVKSANCGRNRGSLPDEQREALHKGITPKVWFILLALVLEVWDASNFNRS